MAANRITVTPEPGWYRFSFSLRFTTDVAGAVLELTTPARKHIFTLPTSQTNLNIRDIDIFVSSGSQLSIQARVLAGAATLQSGAWMYIWRLDI